LHNLCIELDKLPDEIGSMDCFDYDMFLEINKAKADKIAKKQKREKELMQEAEDKFKVKKGR
jgi:hypothetical protein